jgi:hypothetical protein
VVKHKATAATIELAVAKFFNYRQNLIIPNLSYGAGLHECDLVVLMRSGYAYEVEIKVSATDIKADLKKDHGHESDLIRLFYFAIPEELLPHAVNIPIHAGIIKVSRGLVPEYKLTGYGVEKTGNMASLDRVEIFRPPHVNKNSRKWTNDERMNLMRLSTMRIWSLKDKLLRVSEKAQGLPPRQL